MKEQKEIRDNDIKTIKELMTKHMITEVIYDKDKSADKDTAEFIVNFAD